MEFHPRRARQVRAVLLLGILLDLALTDVRGRRLGVGLALITGLRDSHLDDTAAAALPPGRVYGMPIRRQRSILLVGGEPWWRAGLLLGVIVGAAREEVLVGAL